MKIDYSDEALRRMADAENKLGPIGDGGSVVGGFAQAKRRHDNAIAALHAFSDVFGMIADHAVFSALKGDLGRAEIQLVTDFMNVREYVTVIIRCVDSSRVDDTVCDIYEVRLEGRLLRTLRDGEHRPVALRALRAAVDARLAGADWPAVLDAAQLAANKGVEQ